MNRLSFDDWEEWEETKGVNFSERMSVVRILARATRYAQQCFRGSHEMDVLLEHDAIASALDSALGFAEMSKEKPGPYFWTLIASAARLMELPEIKKEAEKRAREPGPDPIDEIRNLVSGHPFEERISKLLDGIEKKRKKGRAR